MQRADKRKFHIIYKITCLLNNKFYIGMHSTDDLMDGYFGSGKRLLRSVRKHGKENHKFEVLEYHESRKNLANREKVLVNNELIENTLCMNLREGGIGGWDHCNKKGLWLGKSNHHIFSEKYQTDEIFRKNIKEKWSKAQTKRFQENGYPKGFGGSPFAGKKHSEETKKKMRESTIGSQVGEKNSQFGTCWIYNDEKMSNKKINRNDLENYIIIGWVKGRKTFL